MKFFFFLVYLICITTAQEKVPNNIKRPVTSFASEVHTKTSKISSGNFLVSPFSTETILALVQFGAVGETAKELRDVLHLPNNEAEIKSAVNSLLLKFRNNDLYTLRPANKIYTKEDFQIKADFQSVAANDFLAGIEPANFLKSSEIANIINKWVEEQTENKIKNLMKAENFSGRTRAILINALYFKAEWLTEFRVELTKKKKFYRTSNDIVDVDTLNIRNTIFKYFESPHLRAQFLKLPFRGNASITIVLPNEKEGLSRLEQNMEGVLNTRDLKPGSLNVTLPKFNFETTINFKKILNDLGVLKIFDTEADLSGIAGKKGDLYVNEVTQKAVIDLNEFGVEAAAVTYASYVAPLSAPLIAKKSFIADHPFIFYIEVEGVIIFTGRVVDPLSH